MLISGLAEEPCQLFLGTDAWSGLDVRWCPPDQLATQAANQHILWLYRAPWLPPTVEPDQDNEAKSGEWLAKWANYNRTILQLRPSLGNQLLLVNIDRVPASLLVNKLLGKPFSPDDGPSSLLAPGLLAQVTVWCAPHLWDIYESLEASSWIPTGEPQFRHAITLNESDLHKFLHKLSRLAYLQKQVDEAKQSQKKHAMDAYTWETEKNNLSQENTLLLQQLHQVQEKLEKYYLENIELGKQIKETKALKVQTRQLQHELRRLRMFTPRPLPTSKALVPVDSRSQKPHSLYKWSRWVPRPAKAVLRRSRSRKSLQEQANLIRASGWFDGQWYLREYPDVREARIDPAEHYLSTGWKESRNPGQSFNTAYYLQHNPDIMESGINPLWHFIHYGRNEGRLPRKP